MPVTSADPSMNQSIAIDVREVSFAYPAQRTKRRRRKNNKSHDRAALQNVSLQIQAGETVALLGPNGSGKSTLLKIIATILKPDSGKVQINGSDNPATARTQLGVVFQRPGLDALMTIRENLCDSARLYGVTGGDLQNVIRRALEQLQLSDRQNDLVKTLSGGLARRADLCRAMLHSPPIVLLDEPTTGLDPTARRSFLELIDQQHNASNLTVLMTTHLTDEADRFDRVIFMHEGKIVANDTPANLRKAVGSTRLSVTDDSWTPTNNTLPWRQQSDGWMLDAKGANVDLSAVAANLIQHNIPFTVSSPTLADSFEQLTGATLNVHAEEAS